MTLPMTTESTWSGRTPAASRVALHAAVCSNDPFVFLNAPPNVPKAVRLAPTMKIPLKIQRKIYMELCPQHDTKVWNTYLLLWLTSSQYMVYERRICIYNMHDFCKSRWAAKLTQRSIFWLSHSAFNWRSKIVALTAFCYEFIHEYNRILVYIRVTSW